MFPPCLTQVVALLVLALVTARVANGQLLAFVALCLASIALLAKLILDHGDAYVNKPVTSPFKPRPRETSFR